MQVVVSSIPDLRLNDWGDLLRTRHRRILARATPSPTPCSMPEHGCPLRLVGGRELLSTGAGLQEWHEQLITVCERLLKSLLRK